MMRFLSVTVLLSLAFCARVSPNEGKTCRTETRRECKQVVRNNVPAMDCQDVEHEVCQVCTMEESENCTQVEEPHMVETMETVCEKVPSKTCEKVMMTVYEEVSPQSLLVFPQREYEFFRFQSRAVWTRWSLCVRRFLSVSAR